ncbi:hypothetical protein MKX03_002066 [Papaver bracteatum]|nr:hypothetical protein MKX03_002066 [Papaver bracteatum]
MRRGRNYEKPSPSDSVTVACPDHLILADLPVAKKSIGTASATTHLKAVGRSCYLCDDQIQKIQTIKMMEGIYICTAPHCLRSFLKRSEFEAHIHETHADLLQPNSEKEDGNESDSFNAIRSFLNYLMLFMTKMIKSSFRLHLKPTDEENDENGFLW